MDNKNTYMAATPSKSKHDHAMDEGRRYDGTINTILRILKAEQDDNTDQAQH